MKRKIQIAIGLVVVCIAAYWMVSEYWSRSYRNLPPRSGRTWVAFGDSLTAGYGATEGNDYPAQLGRRLGVTIINRGVPGETSKEGLARLDEILKLDPKVVLLCLGGNDGLRKISVSETMTNLSSIVERLQEKGTFVVIIGIRSATIFDQNKGVFKKLARKHRAFYIPNLLEDVFAHARLMSDEIHPNDEGYAVIAERLENVLRPLMPKLQEKEGAKFEVIVPSGQ